MVVYRCRFNAERLRVQAKHMLRKAERTGEAGRADAADADPAPVH